MISGSESKELTVLCGDFDGKSYVEGDAPWKTGGLLRPKHGRHSKRSETPIIKLQVKK